MIFTVWRFTTTISSREASIHFQRWAEEPQLFVCRRRKRVSLYLFDEKAGTAALDHAGGNLHLEIPSRMQVLETKSPGATLARFGFNRSFIADMIINFFGFIPFGFILFATLIRFGETFEKHGVLITVAFCFSVSLALEIVQAWIPSRSSHMLDLLLNTLGGWLGAVGCRFFGKVQGFWVQGSKVD